MLEYFSRLPICCLLVLPWLLLNGCDDRRETDLTSSIRQAEAPPPVESPAPELLLSQRAFIEVSEKVTPTVVNVRAERVHKVERLSPLFEDFFGKFFRTPPAEQRERSLGSGFILSSDGYILTNEHVVSGAQQIKVRLTDQRIFPGKVVGVDPKTDIAVIKIDAEGSLPVAVLGNSDQLKVGQWALAIGNPFGLDSTLTVGVISATGRTDLGIEDYENFIQTDASINPGNSGGPLLNIYGEVVGVNTAIVASGQGIGFAIPINLARLIADQLISTGGVTRGWLGVSIQPMDDALAESFGLDRVTGALVTRVLPGTPAEQAGMQRGDVLLSFDGKPVRSVKELQLLVASAPLGKSIAVEVLREEKPLTLNVVIVARDELAQPERQSREEQSTLWLGMRFAETSAGVQVVELEPNSVAARAGVEAGDLVLAINHHPVETLADVNRIRRDSSAEDRVLLLLQRGEASLYLALPLN